MRLPLTVRGGLWRRCMRASGFEAPALLTPIAIACLRLLTSPPAYLCSPCLNSCLNLADDIFLITCFLAHRRS
jgi:hypothetical protein